MSSHTITQSALLAYIYHDIELRTALLAGPPPPANYQGHHFIDIELSLGKSSLADIGRYSAKCAHPNHRNKSRYPNCHRVRMVTPPLQGVYFELLRAKVYQYTHVSKQPWGSGQIASTAKPVQIHFFRRGRPRSVSNSSYSSFEIHYLKFRNQRALSFEIEPLSCPVSVSRAPRSQIEQTFSYITWRKATLAPIASSPPIATFRAHSAKSQVVNLHLP
ncbi:hypothetical protein NMY22_g17849 [Coprinellus aureogranulatus]|nr:hypothetical protein NMY22_g17849 [Coprinellus aureogranulatus]